MRFSLLILGAPYSTQSAATALRFARAAIAAGHQVNRVFLYHDAVNLANSLGTPPQDEANLQQGWQQLARDNRIDMVVCIASALKRGVIDATEADRYEKPASNLADEFEISGLGQLIDAAVHCDRMVTFGP